MWGLEGESEGGCEGWGRGEGVRREGEGLSEGLEGEGERGRDESMGVGGRWKGRKGEGGRIWGLGDLKKVKCEDWRELNVGLGGGG